MSTSENSNIRVRLSESPLWKLLGHHRNVCFSSRDSLVFGIAPSLDFQLHVGPSNLCRLLRMRSSLTRDLPEYIRNTWACTFHIRIPTSKGSLSWSQLLSKSYARNAFTDAILALDLPLSVYCESLISVDYIFFCSVCVFVSLNLSDETLPVIVRIDLQS